MNQRLRCSELPWVNEFGDHVAARLPLQPIVANG